MPLYEYKCLSCEKLHEVMQKFSDPPLEKCPECDGSVTKIMSLSSFALKGTGWYTTDYKRAGSTTSTSASKGTTSSTSETKSESKTEGKTESKPDSKVEAKKDTSSASSSPGAATS